MHGEGLSKSPLIKEFLFKEKNMIKLLIQRIFFIQGKKYDQVVDSKNTSVQHRTSSARFLLFMAQHYKPASQIIK